MEVPIVLDGKAPESPLVDVPKTSRSMVCVISLSVSQRNPSQKLTHAAVLMRRKNHVPVIFHPLIGDQVDGELFQSLGNDSLEGFIICIFEEDWILRIATIKRVINPASFIGTRRSTHRCPQSVNSKSPIGAKQTHPINPHATHSLNSVPDTF